MTLASLVGALLLDIFYPAELREKLAALLTRYLRLLEKRFNTGNVRQGGLAWLLALAPLCLASWIVYLLLYSAGVLLAWLYNIVILYLCTELYSLHRFSRELTQSLKNAASEDAARILAQAQYQAEPSGTQEQFIQLGIRHILIRAHHQGLGVLFWFIILGPAGAILYRLAYMTREQWVAPDKEEGAFSQFAKQAFDLLDWAPLRLTALSFAVTGNFEDALYCLRVQSVPELAPVEAIVLSSGAGAMGIQLKDDVREENTRSIELGMGNPPDVQDIASAMSLVWRSVVLWLGLVVLLSIAHWTG
jgi:adenosylcobinamide-phosphate synthase